MMTQQLMDKMGYELPPEVAAPNAMPPGLYAIEIQSVSPDGRVEGRIVAHDLTINEET